MWAAHAGVASPSSRPLRLSTFVLVAILFALFVEASAARAQVPDDASATLYRQAVVRLESGETQTALDLLEQVVASNPRHAGARLDLILGHCALGRLSVAERHFESLGALTGVPVALLQIAQAALATGCPGRGAGQRVWATAGLALGRTSNVNAGPSSERVWFASGAPIDYLDFTQESLPRPDWMKTFSAGAGYGRWVLQGEFRKHHHQSAYDAVQLQAGRVAPAAGFWGLEDARWSTQAGAWWQRRGSKEHSLGVSYEAWRPGAGPLGRWGVGAKAVLLDYPRDADYRSLRLEAGPRLAGRWGPAHLATAVELTLDHALADRPGADRWGLQLNLEASRPLLAGQLQLNLLAQTQRDQDPFNTVFFGDLHRNARRIYATATQVWPLPLLPQSAGRLSGYIRLTSDRTADSTGLYSSSAHQAFIGIRAGF